MRNPLLKRWVCSGPARIMPGLLVLLTGLVGAYHIGRRESERELTDVEGTSEMRRAQPEMGRK